MRGISWRVDFKILFNQDVQVYAGQQCLAVDGFGARKGAAYLILDHFKRLAIMVKAVKHTGQKLGDYDGAGYGDDFVEGCNLLWGCSGPFRAQDMVQEASATVLKFETAKGMTTSVFRCRESLGEEERRYTLRCALLRTLLSVPVLHSSVVRRQKPLEEKE